MTRRRWIADEFSNDLAVLTGAHAAHLSRTLRARVGQQFEVACGDHVRRATVIRLTDDRVEFTLGEEIAAPAIVPITLLLAILKFNRMEWAIEKCTELNVTAVVPVVACRTEKHLAVAAAKRVERWRRIAREAAEQSRRTAPPEIRDPLKLRDAIAKVARYKPSACLPQSHEVGIIQPRSGGTGVSPARKPGVGSELDSSLVGKAQVLTHTLKAGCEVLCEENGDFADLHIVLAESERDVTLSEILRGRENITSLVFAVGPEGGWTAEELQLFERSRWLAASLGETILRAETAAVAALAITSAEV